MTQDAPERLSDTEFMAALNKTRKKLYWRAIRRGMKESDVLIGGFARTYLHSLTEDEVAEFTKILSLFDADFLAYIMGQKSLPSDIDPDLFERIRTFAPYEHE